MIIRFELAGEIATVLDNVTASPPPWLTLSQATACYEFEMLLKAQEPKEN